MSDLGIDVQAGLSVSIGGVERQVKALRRDLQSAARRMPIDETVGATAICPAGGGNFSIGMGGPARGRKWLVRRVALGGGAFPFTAAGSGYLFAGTDPAGPGGVVPGQFIDYASSFPLVSYWSSRQLILWPGQSLYVYVTGGTAGTQYYASGQVENWPDEPLAVSDID